MNREQLHNETHSLPRLCENSDGDDVSARRLHKVRTGSGSDRVVSQMLDYGGHYKILPYWKKRNDCACVSTRSLPLPVLTLCSSAVLYSSPFAFSHSRYRAVVLTS